MSMYVTADTREEEKNNNCKPVKQADSTTEDGKSI